MNPTENKITVKQLDGIISISQKNKTINVGRQVNSVSVKQSSQTIKVVNDASSISVKNQEVSITVVQTGKQGAAGVGVPAGGDTGQVLAKTSNTDYETEWVDQSGGGGAVDSVNGQTGVVVLDKGDIGLGQVDNTSDVDKPVSNATQSELDEKVNITAAYNEGDLYVRFGGGASGLSKADLAADSAFANTYDQIGAASAAEQNANDYTDTEISGLTFVESVQAGLNITIDDTDPQNPIISASGGNTGYRLQNQELTGTYAYAGYEHETDGSWYIYRRTRSNNLRQYAHGVTDYSTNWGNRGSLIYS